MEGGGDIGSEFFWLLEDNRSCSMCVACDRVVAMVGQFLSKMTGVDIWTNIGKVTFPALTFFVQHALP